MYVKIIIIINIPIMHWSIPSPPLIWLNEPGLDHFAPGSAFFLLLLETYTKGRTATNMCTIDLNSAVNISCTSSTVHCRLLK